MSSERKGSGRPRIFGPEGPEKFTVELTLEHRDKLRRLGASKWIRKMIDEAPEPEKPTVKIKPAADALTMAVRSMVGAE